MKLKLFTTTEHGKIFKSTVPSHSQDNPVLCTHKLIRLKSVNFLNCLEIQIAYVDCIVSISSMFFRRT